MPSGYYVMFEDGTYQTTREVYEWVMRTMPFLRDVWNEVMAKSKVNALYWANLED